MSEFFEIVLAAIILLLIVFAIPLGFFLMLHWVHYLYLNLAPWL